MYIYLVCSSRHRPLSAACCAAVWWSLVTAGDMYCLVLICDGKALFLRGVQQSKFLENLDPHSSSSTNNREWRIGENFYRSRSREIAKIAIMNGQCVRLYQYYIYRERTIYNKYSYIAIAIGLESVRRFTVTFLYAALPALQWSLLPL